LALDVALTAFAEVLGGPLFNVVVSAPRQAVSVLVDSVKTRQSDERIADTLVSVGANSFTQAALDNLVAPDDAIPTAMPAAIAPHQDIVDIGTWQVLGWQPS
jgi:hypothetical protein